MGHPATGNRNGQSERAAERRREILRADPYYPHTVWRAVVAWLGYFFIFLGFAAFIILLVPDREFGWYYVVYTAVFATGGTGMLFLNRRARVRMLENTGQIPREGDAPGESFRG
ncbi:hypothetical protein C1C97_008695 [Kocuria tytonis]|uniref:Uncharacterized protein n=1 Tax=Kocuria tytonis TaxID=2054280 RepID=A0A495A6N2_9MICC|nr:hypothetical protein C1C97_008695 [Kocuria tytonis]